MILTLTATALLISLTATTTAGHEVIELHGSGTTNPSKCLWSIMEMFGERVKEPVQITYRAIGSGPGQTEFLGEENEAGPWTPYTDFGAGDIPVSTDKYTALNDNTSGMVHMPFVMGAISMFHSVPGVPDGSDGLNLNACTLSKIFNRDIIFWDDAEIIALNPDLGSKLPYANYPITVARRSTGSSSTASITEYLHKACPSEWPLEQVGKIITWAEGTKECDGSAAMTACIRDFPGTIGYIDSGHGHEEQLIEIELENANEKFLSSKSAGDAGIAAAASSVPPSDEDYGTVSLLNQPGDNTWPIVTISYLYVRQDISYMEAESQGLLIAFLKSLYDPDTIGMCSDFGFVPVNADVKNIAFAGIQLLESSNPTAQPWTFESASTTDVGPGANDYVISGKRRSFAEYERTINEGKIADLEEKIAQLEASIMNADSSSSSGNSDDDKNDELALGLSILSLILWAGSFVVFLMRKKLFHANVDDGSVVSDLNLHENGNGVKSSTNV